MNLYDGVETEECVWMGKTYYECGVCNELIAEKGGEIPEKCPFCGVKVRKGGNADA